ncbi:DedA family protein [Marinibacterium profundimaris]|uniref:DedA family protein n=1 Tax=Marinibacterium profundimaris TaxID=1679460 RepID=UPI000B5242AF|nr:DedA family protein [Marinibacterium profundimaris]
MSLEHLVQTLGLPGVVIGAALEGEGVAFLSGVFAHRHIFHFEAAALAVALGAVITDNVTFAIGRYGGRSGYAQKLLSHRRVARLREMLDRHQTKVILGFRFVYGLKTVGPILIGSSPVSWARFALLDALAVLVWAHLWVAMGYGVGTAIEALFGRMKLESHAAVALVVFLVLAGAGWYALRRWRLRQDDKAIAASGIAEQTPGGAALDQDDKDKGGDRR